MRQSVNKYKIYGFYLLFELVYSVWIKINAMKIILIRISIILIINCLPLKEALRRPFENVICNMNKTDTCN